jgi:hypothetical protein
LLIVVSALATFLCVGIGLGLPPLVAKPGVAWAGGLLLALPPVCALFAVRGYRITPDAILVLRPGWVTRLSRAGLVSVSFEPGVMRCGLRLCGNGGFFAFAGLFWNRDLRTHRAFVTDGQRTVVLRYARRTVVVSPEWPEEFVRELREIP